jgi:hypothetical protein
MAKVNTQKTSQRAHTEEEMLLALRRLEQVKQHLDLLRDDDDPCQVLADVITEVLEKRQSIAGVTSFMQQWLAEHTRR